MARQLQDQGEEVGFLALVDSEPPGMTPPSSGGPRYLMTRMAQFWRDGRLRDAARWKLRVACEGIVSRRVGARSRRRLAELRAVHARAHRVYRPAIVRGDALLIRSSEYAQLRSRDWHLRWAELLSGELKVTVVASTHAGLSLDGAAIAKAIRAEMDAAAGVPGRGEGDPAPPVGGLGGEGGVVIRGVSFDRRARRPVDPSWDLADDGDAIHRAAL